MEFSKVPGSRGYQFYRMRNGQERPMAALCLSLMRQILLQKKNVQDYFKKIRWQSGGFPMRLFL